MYPTHIMPKGPKGQKRPADVISNAVHVMKMATGEVDEAVSLERKNEAAAALGRRGGIARAQKLSHRKRVAIAKTAAQARYQKK